jgi:hypothetical protein
MEDELREFFYVDVDRVRSLLAQLQGGVVDAVHSETSTALEAGAQATLLGFGGRGGYARQERSQESRSLQDLTFVAFERTANEEGLITELGDEFRDPDAWESGDVHSRLREGQLVRVECDVQVLDGGLFVDRIKRLDLMADAMVKISGDVLGLNMSAKQKAAAVAAAKATLLDGLTPTQLQALSDFISSFMGDSISLRVLPCGREHLEFGFSGAMLGRKEYIQEERENLFSRYGSLARSWTVVMQVAAIPQNPADETAAEAASPSVAATPDGAFSRAGMERIAGDLLALMENVGIVEGPRWPSVSVTPLGLYRTVPTIEP